MGYDLSATRPAGSPGDGAHWEKSSLKLVSLAESRPSSYDNHMEILPNVPDQSKDPRQGDSCLGNAKLLFKRCKRRFRVGSIQSLTRKKGDSRKIRLDALSKENKTWIGGGVLRITLMQPTSLHRRLKKSQALI